MLLSKSYFNIVHSQPVQRKMGRSVDSLPLIQAMDLRYVLHICLLLYVFFVYPDQMINCWSISVYCMVTTFAACYIFWTLVLGFVCVSLIYFFISLEVRFKWRGDGSGLNFLVQLYLIWYECCDIWLYVGRLIHLIWNKNWISDEKRRNQSHLHLEERKSARRDRSLRSQYLQYLIWVSCYL